MPPPHPRNWLALGVLGVAYLLILFDGTIVYVALPGILREFGLTYAAAQWAMTAYLLSFGALLLLGGRLSAQLGPRRLFVLGLCLLAVGSLACGLAGSLGVLVTGRAVQGIGAALAAPAALPLLATTFQNGSGRGYALRVWTLIGALAGTVGLLVGGPVTDQLGWRWVFLFSVPIVVVLVLMSPFVLRVAAPVPLVRMRAMYSRIRLGGVLLLCAVGVAVDGNSFLLTVYMQEVLGYSATRFAVMMTAMTLTAIAGSTLGQSAVLRFGLRSVAVASLAVIAGGSALLTRAPSPDGTSRMILALLLLGTGVGAAFVVGQIAVVSAAPEAASLRLSGLTDAAFSIGGAAGLVLLSVVLARTAATTDGAPVAAVVTGLERGFTVATAIAVLGFLTALALPGASRQTVHNGVQRPSQ